MTCCLAHGHPSPIGLVRDFGEPAGRVGTSHGLPEALAAKAELFQRQATIDPFASDPAARTPQRSHAYRAHGSERPGGVPEPFWMSAVGQAPQESSPSSASLSSHELPVPPSIALPSGPTVAAAT